jgi:hypothetical protein
VLVDQFRSSRVGDRCGEVSVAVGIDGDDEVLALLPETKQGSSLTEMNYCAYAMLGFSRNTAEATA